MITNNYIYDNADRGIQLYPDAQGTKIANNVIDGNGEGVLFSGDSGLASSNNVVTRNIVSNATVRYNVESWWPAGNPVGTGNVASDNCVWNGAQGNVADEVGFSASGNKAANPLYANRTTKDFRLQSGSPCVGYGPTATTAQTSDLPPPPASTPPAPPSSAAKRQAPAVPHAARPEAHAAVTHAKTSPQERTPGLHALPGEEPASPAAARAFEAPLDGFESGF